MGLQACQWFSDHEVRRRLRSIVQPKDSLDDVLQGGRHLDRALSAAVPTVRSLILLQDDTKSGVQVFDGSREDDAPPGQARSHDRKTVILGECLDRSQILRIGSMLLGILLSG